MYTLHTSIFLYLITKHQFRNVQSTPLMCSFTTLESSMNPTLQVSTGESPNSGLHICFVVKMYVIWWKIMYNICFIHACKNTCFYGSKYYKYFYTTKRSWFWIINLIIMHIEYTVYHYMLVHCVSPLWPLRRVPLPGRYRRDCKVRVPHLPGVPLAIDRTLDSRLMKSNKTKSFLDVGI